MIVLGIKPEARGFAERAGPVSFVRSADGLRIVLDDRQFARLCERQDGIHFRGEAVEMDDDDGPRARSDAAFEFGGINVVSVRANVRENRLRAESADGASRSHKCKRWHEHFVARLNTARAQSQTQSVRSGSNADAVRD